MRNALTHGPILVADAGTTAGYTALIAFLVYTLAVFVLASLAHRVLTRKSFLGEYFLGSRGLGVLAFTLTYGATSASAGSFAGFPALIYTYGWILALWIASYMVVPVCGMGLLGKRLNQIARKTGAITVPELLGRRFESHAVGLVATFLIIFVLSFYLIPQFKIASYILRTLMADIPPFQAATNLVAALSSRLPFFSAADPEYLFCLMLFGILTIFYTTFGGFRAVVWTDVLQGFVMVFGVVVMLVLSLKQVGGLTSATQQMSLMTPPQYGEARFLCQREVSEDLRIPTDTWFTLQTRAGVPLYRTNELAVVPKGAKRSSEVRIVMLTTPHEIEQYLTQFDDRRPPAIPGDVMPEIVQLRTYLRGHGKAGAFVTGPGPSRDDASGYLPLGMAISFFFYWALSGTGQPGNLTRLMAFDSARTLKRSIAMLSVYFTLIYFPLVVIFCCARVLEPGLDQDADRIMPKLAFTLASGVGWPWLAGVLVAAPFAAAMSTVDSFMLMISASVVRDIYQQHINPQAAETTIKRLSYVCTLIVGLVVAIGAVNPPQFLQDVIVFAGGGLSVSFLIPVSLAIYWRRFNVAGALAAMLGGLALYISLYLYGILFTEAGKMLTPWGVHPLLWGLVTSLLLGIVATLMTKPPPPRLVRQYFYVKQA